MTNPLEDRVCQWLLTEAPYPLLITDASGAIVLSNHAAEQLFGYPREELTRLSLESLLPERLREKHRQDRAKFACDPRLGARKAGNELQALRRDGSEFAVEISLSLIGDGLVLTTIQEITERKRAELALQQSEARFRATFEQAAVGLAHVAPDGRWLRVNHKLCEIVGYSPEELLERTFQDITHPDDLDADLDQVRRMLAHQIDTYSMEKRYIRRDGSTVWVNLTVSLSWKPNGIPDYFISVIEDIQARKEAEAALRESEERYHSTLDNMLEGCHILGFDWRYRYVNKAVVRQARQEKEALLGHTMMEVFPGIEHTPLFAELTRCMNNRVAASLEHELMFPDGARNWFELSIQPAPEGLFVLSIDITERKRSEAALQAMSAEMEQLMRFHVASQTVSALAHELNQPLNALASYAEAALRLLRAGNPQPERLLHALESSAQQAQRAGRVVRELLAFMKQGEVQTEPVDLNQLVHNVLDRVDADGYGGFRVQLELEPGLAPVSANRLQVEKVLANLIENGIEAMRNAGIGARNIAVMVRTNPEGAVAQVTVRDSGPGIDPKILHRIFDPFFTTKAKGLGMGLAISRAIIEFHGGQLWVESEPGSGASFHFTLPFAR